MNSTLYKRKHKGRGATSLDAKRPNVDGFVQCRSKHTKVFERFGSLKTYLDFGRDDGLINEVRKVLRQNKNAKKGKGKVKEDFSDKVQKVLKGSIEGGKLDSETVKGFYEKLLGDDNRPMRVNSGENNSAVLFTVEEVKLCLKHRARGDSCGVDRVSKGMLNAIKRFPARFEYVHAMLNCFLLRGVPESFKVALVTLIPKKKNASTPGDYRPISVTSLIYRLYSRLLSIRFYAAVNTQLSSAQGGYRTKVNGCARNLAILRSVLGEAKTENRSLAVASVDLSKAFDSVSHVAVKNCLGKLKMPDYLRRACLDTLDHNVLKFKGTGVSVTGKRGVPQGLPLSGYLFIATIDQAVKAMDELCPYETASGSKVGALCLVDDLLVFTTSKNDLELKLRRLRSLLSESGWKLNAQKSYAYARVKRGTRMVTETGTVGCGGNESIKLISAREKFKYLGVVISGANCLTDNASPITNKLSESLKAIEKANLSVVHKIRAIKEVIIPQQVYRLSNISSVSIWNAKYKAKKSTHERARSNLTRLYAELDRKIARTVKAILKVPQNTNVSLFYVNESRGGLGLHRLEVLIPIARLKIRETMSVCPKLLAILDKFHFNDRDNCIRLLEKHKLDTENLSREARVNAMVEAARSGSIGRTLILPSKSERVVPLIKNKSGLGFSSYKLQRVVNFKLNSLNTNSRNHIRNPSISKLCRNGCGKLESLAHLLCERRCGRLSDLWITRHNAVCEFLFKRLSKLKRTGVKLAIELETGNFKPDLVLFDSKSALVLEVAVRWGAGKKLTQIFNEKRAKYSKPEAISELKAKLNELEPVANERKVKVTPLVFSVHGSFYDPEGLVSEIGKRMMDTRVLRKLLLISAQIATEHSLKYLGSVLGDRARYSNTRVA